MKKMLSLVITISLLLSFTGLSTYIFADERAVLKLESEPNNTFASADRMIQDETFIATISSASDIDYFVVKFPLSGVVNFWVGNLPNNVDYDLFIYNSSHSLLQSSTSENTQELCTLTVNANIDYFIKVISADGSFDQNEQYNVRCRITPSYNCYSQKGSDYSTPQYSENKMNKVFFKNSANNYVSWKTDMFNEGCWISSFAMILKNKGLKTVSEHDDFRLETHSLMDPDPYTVMFASLNFPSFDSRTLQINGSNVAGFVAHNLETTYPTNVYPGRVATAFGQVAVKYQLSDLSSDLEVAKAIAYQLTLHPEGVGVNFYNPTLDKRHMIVFTKTEYEVPLNYTFPLSGTEFRRNTLEYNLSILEIEATIPSDTASYIAHIGDYESYFYACDPADMSCSNKLFDNTYAHSIYNFTNATIMYVFE